MDVLLWILIGLGGGLAITALAPQMRPRSLSELAWRRVRNMAAGMLGAVAAGYGLVLFDASLSANGLTMALASLAGALWVAGMVEVFASRRRRGESDVPLEREPENTLNTRDTPAYDVARQALVAKLMEDAASHDAGRYVDIGTHLPAIHGAVPQLSPARTRRLELARRFRREWVEARNIGWREGDGEKHIAVADWPRLARVLASDLALDRDSTDRAIVARFADAAPFAASQPIASGSMPVHVAGGPA